MTGVSESDHPPGPAGLPFLGSVHESRRALEFLLENRRDYGDIVHYEFLTESIYQLNHPDDIEAVLVTNNQSFSKSQLTKDVLGPIAGQGLFTSDGDLWRQQRQRIQPAFHPDQIATYTDLIVEATERRCSTWDPGDRIDLNEEMRALTLDIVARALLGVDIESKIDRIGRNLDTLFGRLGSVWYHVLPDWVPTPGNRRFQRALSSLEAIVDGIISERRTDPDGEDVVSRLLAAEFEDGEPMSPRQLRDEVMTFLVAGHETTAQALTFSCYLLASHPRIEGRLVNDVEEHLNGAAPVAADLDHLPSIDRVITETLRLYPPANDIHREPIEGVEIRGYQIPRGATISTPPWVVHRDERWYDEPDAFKPERWTDEFRETLPRLAYFPFGAGPRRCVGERFARLEAALVLTTLHQATHLELRPETSFEVEAEITTRPKHPIWMSVSPR